LFGLLQQMAVVFGVYACARVWGRRLATGCAVVSGLVLIPFGLTALAWVGAVGLAMSGLAAGLAARRRTERREVRGWAFAAGLLLGGALLFRPDLVVAVALATFALLRDGGRDRARALLAGIGVGVAPYAVHVATAGPRNVVQGMIVDPVFHLRGGRSLPIPPSWDRLDGFLQRAGALEQLSWPVPAFRLSQQLFLWFFVLLGTVALLLVAAWRRVRLHPHAARSRALLVVALFSLGLVPQAVQRVDSAHFAWVGCVPMAFLPIALFELASFRRRSLATGRLALASVTVVLAGVVLVIPAFTARTYIDYSLQTFGIHRSAHKISHDGRVFYYGKPDRAAAANLVIAEAARIARPGDRLFVGPADLRKTPYSDAYLYHMLPDLEPATYFIEMDPGVANAEGSRMADDLASADIVILSSIWDDWNEPNDSRKTGSNASERVLARDFCLVGNYLDRYELYRRCS
jgi:hypothetical protein